MSLRPRPIEPVPDQTVQVARAAFVKGNPYLTLRDELGTIFHDDDFADLYSHEDSHRPIMGPIMVPIIPIGRVNSSTVSVLVYFFSPSRRYESEWCAVLPVYVCCFLESPFRVTCCEWIRVCWLIVY